MLPTIRHYPVSYTHLLHICMEQEISGKQIIALQGPFSEEMNTAILHQYQIQCMVTKKSGRAGGYEEKIKAAKKAGIPVYVIGQKKTETGDTFTEVCKKLEVICGCKILPQPVSYTHLHDRI